MRKISRITGKPLPSVKTLERRIERIKKTAADRISVLMKQIAEHRER